MTKKTFYFICTGIILVAILAIGYVMSARDSYNNDMERALAAYQKGNYAQAVRYFQNEDVLANPAASFSLGAMYFSGKGVDVNKPRAMAYYEKAANFNFAPAQTTLAILYADEKNWDKAYQFATKAAEANDLEAILLLAGWYENGMGNRMDMDLAVNYYKKASALGSMDAKTALFSIYKNGKNGFPANPFTAARYYKMLEQQQQNEKNFLQ